MLRSVAQTGAISMRIPDQVGARHEALEESVDVILDVTAQRAQREPLPPSSLVADLAYRSSRAATRRPP